MTIHDRCKPGILRSRPNHFNGVLTIRLVASILILLFGSTAVTAQNCDCPVPTACGPCAGGFTSYSLRFNGTAAATITARDNELLFDGVVNPGDTITIAGSAPDGKFAGPHVQLTIDGVNDARIGTKCPDVSLFETFDSFTMVAAISKDGGPLCCRPEDVDATPPVIVDCPANLSATLPTDACTVAVTWTSPTATDECEVESLVGDHAPGSMFGIGTTTVTYTATDSRGNESSCSFDVTVTDDKAPVLSACPGNITIPINVLCAASATWTPPTASDNCEAAVTSTHDPGDVFPVGTTTVTYTATDAAGNETSCSFTVTVEDNISPVILLCPGDITVSAGSGCETSVTWLPPTYIELCIDTFTSSHDPGDEFPVGTTTVTYTAKDKAGNTTTCSFDVTVEDEVAPVITNCPGDITRSATSSCGTTVTWTAPSTTDSCPVTLTSSHASGSRFPVGTTVVTYTAKDPEGNSSTCSFDVIVVDDKDPVISGCPADISVVASASCQAVASWTPPTATDACTVTMTSTHQPGSRFLIGTTTVTYTATDAHGNSSTCSFDVVVTDNGDPVFVGCPDDITVETTSACLVPVSWTPPSPSDSCPVAFTSTHQPGSNFPIGTTTVTYTATDSQNNTSTCNFTVTVVDNSDPTIAGCPQDITVSAAASCRAVVTWTPPTANDNCGISLTSSHEPGSTFAIGTTTVTYTATDPAGKTATCSFKVLVEDKQAPTFTGCPTEVVAAQSGNCESVVSWSPPLSSDNCGAVTVSSSHTPGSVFNAGITAVTYTATDANGNSSTCTFNVIVSEGEAPQVTGCPEGDINVRAADATTGVSWAEPTASASCGEITVAQTHQPGEVFPPGTTTVTYTFTDNAGREAECSFDVIVEQDNIAVEPATAVTPDGDGHNDTWWVENIERYANNSVLIVDRWGNKIFQATGYDNQKVVWNGSNTSGARVATGTYFFTIEVKTDKATVRQKGFIEVVQ